MKNILEHITKIQKNGVTAALCTIVETKGSAPRKIGAKMIVLPDGTIIGTIGGGNLEKKVIENALLQIKYRSAKLFKHDLLHQHNMCCGGTVLIYIEPILPMNKLYVFGAGHTGVALANHASSLNFDIFVIDDRKSYLDNITNPEINKLNVHYKKMLPSLPMDNQTFITIMTYEHEMDRDILSFCITKPHAYLGMIGSKRKIAVTKKIFLDSKIANEQQLEAVHMPMGHPIGAEGPEEIAISILAEILAVKNSTLTTK